jgi:hypothetical protein
MRSEKEYICDRIRDYTKHDKKSEDRILDFLKVNCLSSLEDCLSLKTLELLFRIETFMFFEGEKA